MTSPSPSPSLASSPAFSSIAPPARASTFGNTDPTSDTLSPFLWVPLVSVALLCLLFICFRRAQSLELYQRLRSYVSIKVASSRWSGVQLGRSRLTGARQATDDSDSFLDEDLLDEEEERGDELPTSLPPPRPSLSQRCFKILEILGWTGQGRKGGTVWGGKDGGVARAFWGIRKKDRVGGIRLGDEEDSTTAGRGKGRGMGGGRIERVQTGRNYSSAAPASPRSPRASSSPKLFDLGEEEEEERRMGEGDAVELAMDFALPGDPLRGGGQSVPARGMQRLA